MADLEVDDALLDRLRTETDPEADAVVAAHFEPGLRTSGDLFAALVRHPADPTRSQGGPVAEFLAERPPWPTWADEQAVAEGQAFFEEWGPQILSSLLFASLPDAYAAAKGVQVLRLTARLASDTRRRLIETTQFVLTAMCPGGLVPGAPGYCDVRRVRLMHAAVRYLIAHDPHVVSTCDDVPEARWCIEWGEPINQEDLVGTLLTFTVVVFDALERSGVSVSHDDASAYLHTWSVIGHLLGIRADLLPLDLPQAERLRNAIRRRHYAPSDAGREMARALVDLASSQMRPRLLAGLPVSTIRYLVGDDVAQLLDLPAPDWTRLMFGPARRVLSAISLEQQHDRVMREITGHLNRTMLSSFLAIERGGDRASFAIPTHLADSWQISRAQAAPVT